MLLKAQIILQLSQACKKKHNEITRARNLKNLKKPRKFKKEKSF